MGSSNSRYMTELDLSDSDDSSELELDTTEIVMGHEETDAALRTPISLPNAQDVLNVNKVLEIEEELDDQDIVSLVYLVSEGKEEFRYFFERLILMKNGGSRKIMSQWAEYHSNRQKNWQNMLIEALCIIKHYHILKVLGYEKSNVIDHFLPNNVPSLHINKLKKSVYRICDHFGMNKMNTFLQHIKVNFDNRGIHFEEIATEYLELYFFKWEINNQLDLYEIKRILKIMNEDSLYNLLDSVLPEVSQPTNNHFVPELERASTSFEIPHNFEALRETVLMTKNRSYPRRKPSSVTSVDNNNPRDHIPHNNAYLDNLKNSSTVMRQDNVNTSLNDSDSVYHIDSKKPGIVLIINQEVFYTEVDPIYKHLLPRQDDKFGFRDGSQKDSERLKTVFTKFGFRVIVENNLNHLDLLQTIKDTTKEVQEESSLIVCIMSHGDQGVVYGSNSCMVKVSKIQEIIMTYNKENLSGKPKILILQSCQGRLCQQLDSSNDSNGDFDDEDFFETDGPHPDFGDMYTFWATIPGFAAIRNRKTGSWFIQAICNNLLKYSHINHFVDICTRASKEVREQQWLKDEKINVMTPIMNSTLGKFFYLPRI